MNKKIATVLLLVVAACSSSKKDDKGATSSGKAQEAPAAPAKPATIDQLKLAYDGPAGEVSDFSMGGDPNWMVQAPGLMFSVGTPKEPKTLETAVEDSKLYDGVKYTVQEKTADGYHLEYNNTGGLGPNYFVEVLRTINGTAYLCSSMVGDTATAAAVAKACQSLRAI